MGEIFLIYCEAFDQDLLNETALHADATGNYLSHVIQQWIAVTNLSADYDNSHQWWHQAQENKI